MYVQFTKSSPSSSSASESSVSPSCSIIGHSSPSIPSSVSTPTSRGASKPSHLVRGFPVTEMISSCFCVQFTDNRCSLKKDIKKSSDTCTCTDCLLKVIRPINMHQLNSTMCVQLCLIISLLLWT